MSSHNISGFQLVLILCFAVAKFDLIGNSTAARIISSICFALLWIKQLAVIAMSTLS
jgi:hypothetical protein